MASTFALVACPLPIAMRDAMRAVLKEFVKPPRELGVLSISVSTGHH